MHDSSPVLRTPRLTLCRAEPADAEAAHAAILASLPALSRYMPWVNPVPTGEDTRKNIARLLESDDPMREFRFTIRENRTGDFVGFIGIRPKDLAIPSFEIGYWMDTRKSGSGFMTEAVGAVAEYAINQLGAGEIRIRAALSNTKSWKIPERLGFTRELVIPCGEPRPDGTREDAVIYVKNRA
ncbi:MAG: GNAT family N-acetyltransferase [Candidatus Sumerlaeia bacterium]